MRTAMVGSLEVSVIGLGCNNFGRALDQAGTNEVVAKSLEVGINFFDTASNYGEAQSEGFLANALGSRRDEAVIGTKFGLAIPGFEQSGGARPEYVRAAIERSLTQLQTDRIDLFQLHFPDPDTPIAETLGAMNELVLEGKVIEIGCSNMSAEQMAEAAAASRDGELARFVSNQIEYSMVNREVETNGSVEVAVDENIALLPFYPLASGLLTGKKRQGQPVEGRLNMDRYQRFLSDDNYAVAERLRAFADRVGQEMSVIALAWVLAQPAVPAVTPGATKPEQVVSNAKASDWVPSEAELAELRELLAT
ncbi:MAG: aldo/keto reductase [Acidimicrobiia bacterium]|nr:aldo/keto reductase [Acidimicrobiia bacterium]